MESKAPDHHIIRLDDWGRIVIPAAIRKALGIDRGTWVDLRQVNGNTFEFRLLSARDSRINQLMRGDYPSPDEDDPLTQELFALFDDVIAEVRAEHHQKRTASEQSTSRSYEGQWHGDTTREEENAARHEFPGGIPATGDMS
jgi:AbrB family looped-hinge helix DNA binding protein